MGTVRQPVRSSDLDDVEFDIIIVGAGTAGSILAARLSEDPELKIALIEAGDDLFPGSELPDLLDPLPIAYGVPGRVWNGLSAEITVHPGDKRVKTFNQGRGIGGGSSINGSFAFRGQPEDYDGWVSAGATGWGWQDVLPYFRKLETDLDIRGPMHGDQGPMLIRREVRSAWSPFSQHLAQTFQDHNYLWLDDYNGEFGDGYASPPMANLPDRRILTSSAYLTPDVRKRPNLTIATNVEVRNILFKDTRAVGVNAIHSDKTVQIRAREVILSCGAIFSPALLQRSGIGPANHLEKLGIEIKADLKARPGPPGP